jgi:negative regulator of sigma E activity
MLEKMINLKNLLAALIIVCLAIPGNAAGPQNLDVEQILRESLHATQNLPFSGIVVLHRKTHNDDWRTKMKVVRFPTGEKTMEILAPEEIKGIRHVLNKDGFFATHLEREQMRKFDRSDTVDSDTLFRAFIKKEVVNLLDMENLDLIFKNYDVKIEKHSEYANRNAVKINIHSKCQNRPFFNVWIDTQTKLRLKYQKFFPDGKFDESLSFEELDENPDFSKESLSVEGLRQFSQGKEEEEQEQKSVLLDFSPATPSELPQGFVKISENKWNDRNGPTHHTLYSDGLIFLSLFQRKQTDHEKQKQIEEKISPKTIKLFDRRGRRVFSREMDGLRISAVGDLSNKEISQTLASIPMTEN